MAVPRHRESAGIFYMHAHIERFPVVNNAEPFDHVKLNRMGRTVIVDIGPIIQPDRIHN